MRPAIRAIMFALVALCASSLPAATETERLVTLARVWSTAKYFHPYFVYRDVKWDEALVRAIPKVRAATDDAAFDAAVASMLAELGDSATRVDTPSPPRNDGGETEMTSVGTLDGDTFVMRGGEAIEQAGVFGFRDLMQDSAGEIAKARYIVVDLRTRKRGATLYALDYAAGALTPQPVTAPARWSAVHSGFTPDSGMTSGGYYSGLTSYPGERFDPAAPPSLERVAFIVSPTSQLPTIALALWSAGRAVIVSDAPLTEAAFAKTMEVPLGTGRSAIIRIEEVAMDVAADVVVTSSDPNAAVVRARELVKSHAAIARKPRATPTAQPLLNDAYASITALPSLEMRLLAAVRLWSVIDRFYPYRKLIGDWDAAFAENIPRFIAASTRNDYVGAILQLAAHVEDGHTTVFGPGIPQFFGPHYFPAEVRLVRGAYVVTALNEGGEKGGLRIGDVVKSVDDEALTTRVQRLRNFITASTEPARTNRVVRYALRGSADSMAKVTVERGREQLTLNLPRVGYSPFKPPATPVYRMLSGAIGYADLTRLRAGEVDAMFKELAGAKSIIFDMRGYPNGTAWSIAPRLGSGERRTAALFARPEILASLSYEMVGSSFAFADALPDGRALERYAGKTYMLIDDRAISQSEATALFFEVANGTEFIGTPTAGANGDVTTMVLPGDLYVAFSGHEVRHADGRQLQRVGVVPTIHVEPTIAGLQGGRDEVLDQAIRYAGSKQTSPKR